MAPSGPSFAGAKILLVEDDPEAAELLRLAFQKAGLRRPLRVLPDGEKAVAYLSGDPPYDNSEENPAPCLVLLDLKLPRRSGLDFLAWIKQRPELAGIPVIVLSSSQEACDLDRAYELGAKSYLVKSVELKELMKVAEGIAAYAALLGPKST